MTTTVSDKASDDVVPALSGIEMARELFISGDYAAAISAALPLTQPGNPTPTRIAALLLQASAESELGSYSDSRSTLETLSPLIEYGTARQQAHFYGQRAHVHRKTGNIDAALTDYEGARVWAIASEDDSTIARIRNNLAKIYSEVGRFDEAGKESDEAIAIARRLGENVLLGRYYDQRAQILIDQRAYPEALGYSEKAMDLLSESPALVEARTTHGRVLIGLGGQYLESEDPLATFKAKHSAVKMLQVSLDKELVSLALERTNGRVLSAADLLGVRHSAVIKFARSNAIERRPSWRRRRTYLNKK